MFLKVLSHSCVDANFQNMGCQHHADMLTGAFLELHQHLIWNTRLTLTQSINL